jgi:hypothetical protein
MMRRLLFILITLVFVSQTFAQDVITKKDGVVIHGRVVKRANNAFAVRTNEGNLVVIKEADVASIQRGKLLMDFERQLRFRVEKRRPFLPFLIITGVSAAYGVQKYKDYEKHRDEADEQKAIFGEDNEEYINLNDKSKRDMAMTVISGVVSLGTAYIALRPIEVKTPLGPLNLSMGVKANQVQLAIHF